MGRDIFIYGQKEANSDNKDKELLYKIGITTHCNVFLEELISFLENSKSKIIQNGNDYYIPIDDFEFFIEKLLILCKVFYEFYNQNGIEISVNESKYAPFLIELNEKLRVENEKIKSDTELYDRKWGTNYFSFSMLCSSINDLYLRLTILKKDYNIIFIEDSY